MEGELVAIIGQSGSGKSTLMNMLGCLDVPTSGSYYLHGQDVSHLKDNELSAIRNKEIGFIFQGFNLIANLNAVENVELPLIYRGIGKQERRKLAKEALEMVGLGHRMDHKPSEMSGGQQQRTVILITHDDKIAEQAYRIIRILDGKIESDRKNDKILESREEIK